MAALYFRAARSTYKAPYLPFIILVKATATLFLFTYVLAVDFVWLAAVSGVVDGVFAVLLYTLYRRTGNRAKEL